MSLPIPPLTLDPLIGPALGFRFAVFFFAGGAVPNPIDIRFQRVSGLSASIDTTTIIEGGQTLYTHRLPTRVGYATLVLERGRVVHRSASEKLLADPDTLHRLVSVS